MDGCTWRSCLIVLVQVTTIANITTLEVFYL